MSSDGWKGPEKQDSLQLEPQHDINETEELHLEQELTDSVNHV